MSGVTFVAMHRNTHLALLPWMYIPTQITLRANLASYILHFLDF